MAGVMMEGDEGREVKKISVPSIGGNAEIVATEHPNANVRAEGVSYPENPMEGSNVGHSIVDDLVHPYTETDVGEANNPLKP